jgi:hypothetical protein
VTLDEFIGNLVVLRGIYGGYGGDLQVEMDDGTQATCEIEELHLSFAKVIIKAGLTNDA